MQNRTTELVNNYEELKQDLKLLCQSLNRKSEDLQVVAISKTHPSEDIEILCNHGVRDFGENRVQELIEKMDELQHCDINWHLVGTLQRNKVRFIVGRVALIHSVDSLRLIEEINKRAKNSEVVQEILLQVNVAEEESKHGFSLHELSSAVELLNECSYIRLRGLMCMAPLYEDVSKAYPVFERCAQEFKKLQSYLGADKISILSMGMSGDYSEAIRAGATHIRVGSAIFGKRDYSE